MKKIIFVVLFLSALIEARANDLQTVAEKSNWKRTGNAEETAKLCHAFQKKYPKHVKCRIYGKTPENRNLYYLIVGDSKTPAVWVQAGIHAGEIDGKDATFLLIKQILEGKIKNNPLKGIHLVFIPIVNLDGHERMGKWNRPNQIGPEEMGWRTTSQNYNLNRDFMKVDAPEMESLLTLWHKINPVLSLDLHVTNGAQFQPEVGLIILPNSNHGSSQLHEAGKRFELEILEKMKDRKQFALPFYPSFEIENEPLSGFSRYVSLPRFAHGYWYNNNRLGMLVETHSWKDYKTRTRTHFNTVLSSLEIAQLHAKSWQSAARDLDVKKVTGKVALEYKHTEKKSMIDFAGYEFSKEKSDISGGEIIKYHITKPQVWNLPFYEELESKLTVEAPAEGYFVQLADRHWIIPKLKIHNIKFSMLGNTDLQKMKIFRATKTKYSTQSFEGRQNLSVEGDWKDEAITLQKGSVFIPIAQPKGRLIMQLFEPFSQDSFLAWGFFNRAFEQKEYMESYVAEEVAKEMIKQPEIRKEFEARVEADTEFAKSASNRFEFFYRKHSSWDERFNKYPVFKR